MSVIWMTLDTQNNLTADLSEDEDMDDS